MTVTITATKHTAALIITLARPLPSPVPISDVCPEAGTATDTMTVLMAVTRGTVPLRPLAHVRQTSSSVPTITASLALGSVTPTTTAEMDQTKTTAIRLARVTLVSSSVQTIAASTLIMCVMETEIVLMVQMNKAVCTTAQPMSLSVQTTISV